MTRVEPAVEPETAGATTVAIDAHPACATAAVAVVADQFSRRALTGSHHCGVRIWRGKTGAQFGSTSESRLSSPGEESP